MKYYNPHLLGSCFGWNLKHNYCFWAYSLELIFNADFHQLRMRGGIYPKTLFLWLKHTNPYFLASTTIERVYYKSLETLTGGISMDIFEIAIQMEKEGAVFYYDLADKAPTKGFKTIFKMLAEDEEKHQEVFTKLKNKSESVMVPTKVADKAMSIIRGFKKEDFEKEKAQMQVYERALNVEKMSIEFYEAQMGNLETEEMRKNVEEILNEEKRHYSMLEELIKMLSRPESWVENAEFGVREDY